MIRCPLCQSQRTIIAIGPRCRCLCLMCQTRWFQEGTEVKGIRPGKQLRALRHPSKPSL
jgi:hypothetical protein